MRRYADLHLHSRYARGVSPQAGVENLARAATRKGLALLGSGDITHPGWRRELGERLRPAEPGLFRLAPDLERAALRDGPPGGDAPRFLLNGEVATVSKRDGKGRRVHHVICLPGWQAAEKLCSALAPWGRLEADGRPMLRLDPRDLLEIVLENDPAAFLFPAHIWTPWYAALGAASGFDSLQACYGDLAPHVFAAETGLSSDPPMNWRVSSLHRFRLISCSDAHSPAKLGREATWFDLPGSDFPDFFALRRALEQGEGFGGTVEFFPEEGKYHLDGHRLCHQRMTPEESRSRNGLCPTCGEPATIGVRHRVEALADRPPDAPPPATAAPFLSLVPLEEILGEIRGRSPASQGVQQAREALIQSLGPELPLLIDLPLADIARVGGELLAEAIRRLRRGETIRESGYDGAYGTIRLFRPGELQGWGGAPKSISGNRR